MFNLTPHYRSSWIFRAINGVVLAAFFVLTVLPAPAMAQGIHPGSGTTPGVGFLPPPGAMVALSPAFVPATIKGIKLHPDNPLRFDFIIDTGDSDLRDQALQDETNKLIKYFLASLTVPEDDLWVNLSPYEKDRIIPNEFGTTEMGRDLLAQDYLLKQITSSLIYPDSELGKKFWDRVYAKAKEKYGTIDIPVNTFNKVWVIPDKARIYKHDNAAFVVEAHLKVMLEEDYLAFSNQSAAVSPLKAESRELKADTSQIIRDLIIPELEKEVNEGKNFAQLRQVYNSLILATWFKRNLKENLLSKVYVGRNKVEGVDIEDKDAKQKIYDTYLEAYKKGVYNFIKEEYDPAAEEEIPRKYFSGGVHFAKTTEAIIDETGTAPEFHIDTNRAMMATADFKRSDAAPAKSPDRAMMGYQTARILALTGLAMCGAACAVAPNRLVIPDYVRQTVKPVVPIPVPGGNIFLMGQLHSPAALVMDFGQRLRAGQLDNEFVDQFLEFTQPIITAYQGDISKIKTMLSDPSNAIKAIGLEFSPQDMDNIVNNIGLLKINLQTVLKSLGYSDDTVDQIALVLEGPVFYLYMNHDPVLQGIKLIGVEDAKSKSASIEQLMLITNKVSQLTSAAQDKGISGNAVKDWFLKVNEQLRFRSEALTEREMNQMAGSSWVDEELSAQAKDIIAGIIAANKTVEDRDPLTAGNVVAAQKKFGGLLVLIGASHVPPLERSIEQVLQAGAPVRDRAMMGTRREAIQQIAQRRSEVLQELPGKVDGFLKKRSAEDRRPDVIGIFAEHAYQDGFEKLGPGIREVIETARSLKRKVVVIWEDNRGPDQIKLQMDPNSKDPRYLAWEKELRSELKGISLGRIKGGRYLSAIFRSFGVQAASQFKGGRFDQPIIPAEAQGLLGPSAQFDKSFQEFLRPYLDDGSVVVELEPASEKAWLVGVKESVMDVDSQVAYQLGKSDAYEKLLKLRIPYFKMFNNLRDEAVIAALEGDLSKKYGNDAVFLVIRGTSHYSMMEKMDTTKVRWLTALADDMRPEFSQPVHLLAVQRGAAELTPDQREYLLGEFKFLEIAGPIASDPAVTSSAEYQRRLRAEVEKVMSEGLLEQLQQQLPAPMPFIKDSDNVDRAMMSPELQSELELEDAILVGQHPVGEKDFSKKELEELLADAAAKELVLQNEQSLKAWRVDLEDLMDEAGNPAAKTILNLPEMRESFQQLAAFLTGRGSGQKVKIRGKEYTVNIYLNVWMPGFATARGRTAGAFTVKHGGTMDIYFSDIAGLIHEVLEQVIFPSRAGSEMRKDHYHTLAFFAEGILRGEKRYNENYNQTVFVPQRAIAQLASWKSLPGGTKRLRKFAKAAARVEKEIEERKFNLETSFHSIYRDYANSMAQALKDHAFSEVDDLEEEAMLRESPDVPDTDRQTVVVEVGGQLREVLPEQLPDGARTVANISVASRRGERKDGQQDRFVTASVNLPGVANGTGQLAAVFDGFGGEDTAEDLKNNLQKVFEEALRNDTTGDVQEVLKVTVTRLQELTGENWSGSTGTITYLHGAVLDAAVVGDSPLFVKDKDGRVIKSVEHNTYNPAEVEAALARGAVLDERNVYLQYPGGENLLLTRAFGSFFAKDAIGRTPDLYHFDLAPDSFVFLASDGITNMRDPEKAFDETGIRDAVEQGWTAQKIVDEALKKGSFDNVTAILLKPSFDRAMTARRDKKEDPELDPGTLWARIRNSWQRGPGVPVNITDVNRAKVEEIERLVAGGGFEVVGGLARPDHYRLLKRYTGSGLLATREGVYSPIRDGMLTISKFLPEIEYQLSEFIPQLLQSGKKEIRILVIGAGTGVDAASAIHQAKRFGLTIDLDAIDINPAAVETAQYNFDHAYKDQLTSEDKVRVAAVRLGQEFNGLRGPYDLILFNAPNAVRQLSTADGAVEMYESDFKRILEVMRDRLLDPAGMALVGNLRRVILPGERVIPQGLEAMLSAGEWSRAGVDIEGNAEQRIFFLLKHTERARRESAAAQVRLDKMMGRDRAMMSSQEFRYFQFRILDQLAEFQFKRETQFRRMSKLIALSLGLIPEGDLADESPLSDEIFMESLRRLNEFSLDKIMPAVNRSQYLHYTFAAARLGGFLSSSRFDAAAMREDLTKFKTLLGDQRIVDFIAAQREGSGVLSKLRLSIVFDPKDGRLAHVGTTFGEEIPHFQFIVGLNEDGTVSRADVEPKGWADIPPNIQNMLEAYNLEVSRGADRAMMGGAKDVGGIDLNPANLNIEAEGQNIQLNVPAVDMKMFEGPGFKGLTPFIIQIVPVTNLPLLLGTGWMSPHPGDLPAGRQGG